MQMKRENPLRKVLMMTVQLQLLILSRVLRPEIEGSEVASHLVVAPEGHLTLVEDVDDDAEEHEVVPQLSIDEIIEEVQEYGRGKRRRTTSTWYGGDYERH
jgi:hypothetical protein